MKYLYRDLAPLEQANLLGEQVNLLVRHKLTSYLFKNDFTLHFELTKEGNIHSHFIFPCETKYYLYDVHTITLEKVWKRLVKSKTIHASKFKYVKDLPGIIEYITKEDALPDMIIEINPIYNQLNKNI